MFAQNATLSRIVKRNYRSAAVLHRFGIDFYRKPEHTLAEACQERRINTQLVSKALRTGLTAQGQDSTDFERLSKLSATQIIQYLKLQHREFIFRKLPYMQRLIADSEAFSPTQNYREILEDLRLAFPLFSEDFARHIFEEEENMFTYIELLHEVLFSGKHFSQTYMRMERCSVMEFLSQHHEEDDDMSGIRQITQDYRLSSEADLLIEVLYAELQAFEQQLKFHARLENQALLPKALKLESGVKWLMERKRQLN